MTGQRKSTHTWGRPINSQVQSRHTKGVIMPEEAKKPTIQRVQFGKDATAEAIFAGIKAAQDKWAKQHPDRAHELYPHVFDEKGNRIKAKAE
jgi:hypothetical protein